MHSKELDKLIDSRSKNWDIDRIALIDKLILRIALVEMVYVDDVPPKVSIAEGVEIAKQFSTTDSSGFINGILDSVYNETIKGKSGQKIWFRFTERLFARPIIIIAIIQLPII